MSTTEPTDEMVEAALRAFGALVGSEVSGTTEERMVLALRAALAVSSPSAPTEDDREAAPDGSIWRRLKAIEQEAVAAYSERDDDRTWTSIFDEAFLAEFARRSPVAPSEPGRLDPDWRAALVDAATHAIKAVWADVPGGVDAETLAQNVVSTQEFFWLSRQFPVAPSEDVAKLIDTLRRDAHTPGVAPATALQAANALAALRSGAAVPVESADTMFTSEYVDALRAELTAVETVSTFEELDALPGETIIKDGHGDVLKSFTLSHPHPRALHGWEMVGEEGWVHPDQIKLPARVLFRPDREER